MSTKYWIINGQAVSDYHVLGYTKYPSNPCSVWNDNGDLIVNAWQASENEPDVASFYWLSDNGSGGTVNRWFADESELESFGFHLTPPVTGFVYGVMDDTQDKDKGAIETGFTGYMELIHGNMIDCGVGEYGVIKEPQTVQISFGIDTIVPQNITRMVNDYWWMDNFNGGSSLSNLWTPNEFASQLLADSQQETPNGYEYGNIYFWNGSSIMDFEDLNVSVQLRTYNGKPEFYTNLSTSVTGSLCGIIIQPGAAPTWTNESWFNIPQSTYSISGTTITWNTSHILYNLFYGKTVTVYYIP